MALKVSDLAKDLIKGASEVANNDWQQISSAAMIELKALAEKLALIVNGYLGGQLSKESAEGHFAVARFHVVATIAMLSQMIGSTIEKVVNGALQKIRDTVNAAIGFTLIW